MQKLTQKTFIKLGLH